MLLPAAAHAGGIEVPDLGTVAAGRGAAFVARADDPSAFYYNPAGLTKARRGQVMLNANFWHSSVTFTRSGSDSDYCFEVDEATGACVHQAHDPARDYSQTSTANGPGAIRDYQSVSQQAALGPAPLLVGSWTGIGRARTLALALGVVPPSSFGGPRFPSDGAQRYMLQYAKALVVYPGVSVAWAPTRWFSFGATFLAGMSIIHVGQAVRPAIQRGDPLRNEDQGGDARFEIAAKDLFMPAGILGVLVRPVEFLELGLSARTPVNLRARGELSYAAPDVDVPDSKLVGSREVTLSQTFPWIVCSGVRYVHCWFDVEVDVVYERWRRLRSFDVDVADGARIDQDGDPNTMGDQVQVPDAKIPKNFRDTWSVRLGGDVALWPRHLTGRAGAWYQTSAFPKNYDTFNVDFPFGEQVGVGGGLTWHVIPQLDLMVVYSHVFQRDVQVRQGIVQQQAPPFQGRAIGNTVNNGDYHVSLDLFGLGALGRF
jgi:long-chain fatty acid transport protein